MTNRWRSKRGDIEPSIMLDGCTLSNTVKPEHVSDFTVWGNSRRLDLPLYFQTPVIT
ncbi:hypothetical protein BK263_24810 [Escherichia coli]|nr:hypothetical protein BK263_24810 [Escherichia coli]